ncbi:MAG: hypothetical protein OM95_09025 [Bdellovibrio sp. ArHS]|uniref:BatD family protein n=1 Tax=Bdellovibrio sp. ArHS TaxID=1569284 RepID=UPI000583875C|nr:BatD family protein [Bdellovibrio sp. ArHS]KHD88285.1 MAG: hypothetical protein OM95_09025 [Bdellovibrio sp. ArHS]
MTKTGNFLFFLIFLIFGFFAQATPTVQATVDRNEVGLTDTFTVTVSIVSTDDHTIAEPRIPDLDGFELLNNSQSTAVAQKLVNTPQGMQFETQRRKEFHYIMGPKRTGTLSVDSFEVIVDGKVYRTKPILVKVSEQGSGQNRPKRPSQNPAFEDPFEAMDQADEEIFNQLLKQRQRLLQQQMGQFPDDTNWPPRATGLPEAAFRSLPTNPNEAFFISVEVDKTEVYEGEQVTVNWYIYTRGQMETLDRLKFPSLKGFWKEIIEEVPSIQFTEEVVNGVPWKKALLASHALFPIKPGRAVIDEYKIKSRVRTLSQGLGGFYGRPYEYTKSSARVDIKVKPLPTEGRPSDFTGAVGQFEVHASVENQTTPVNQPVSLKVRFEGAGNAKVIDLPAIAWPTGLEQYDTKSESKFFKNGRSYKEFEVLVIPRQEGDMVIPALSVSMFDPQANKYYTRTTQPITLKVVNNPNAPVGSSSRLADGKTSAKSTIMENKLPNPVMSWAPATEAHVLYRPWLWMVVYGAMALGLLVKAQKEFGWGRRRRTLKELVNKRYKQVDGALSKNDYRKVGVEMTNIFYLVLGEVAGEGGASQEIERLLALMPPSLRRDHGDEIAKNFEIFQTMSFAPEEMLGALKDSSSMKVNVEKAKKIISSVIAAVEAK